MATWTEKQIASLSGSALDLYNKLVAQGIRPADALNRARGTYPQSTAKATQSNQASSSTSLRPDQVTTETMEATFGTGVTGTINPITNVPIDPVSGQPLQKTTTPVKESAGNSDRYVVQVVERNGRLIQIWSDGSETDIGMSETARALEAQKLADAAALQRQRVSSKASLEAWLKTFFDTNRDADTIKQLMSFIDQQVTSDIPEDAIMINIRGQKFYQDRFAGNEALRKKGMAELTPAEYLEAERSYSQILKQTGLDRLATRQNFSSLIGGEVSTMELQDRVTNVYSRIVNADENLRKELQGLKSNANITDSDLAESLLLGKEGAAILKRKIAMAEIGAEFTPRGLTSALGAEELVNLGVTREQARVGAEYARAGTGRLQDLATIYGVQSAEIQKELETEAFKGLESQRRKQLVSRERAAFAGSAGTGTPSLGTSAAGAI